MKRTLCALMMASASGLAIADSTPYFGVQYGYLDFERGAVKEASLDALSLRGGLEINELLSGEVRLGTGLFDDDYRGIDAEMNYYYGVYAVVNLPTGGKLDPYLIGGYSYVDSSVGNEDYRDDGAAYGAGLNWAMDDQSALTLEYLKLVDNDHSKQNVVSVGMVYRF